MAEIIESSNYLKPKIMTIPKGTDLGQSFERLKTAMKEAEEMRKENSVDGLVSAYSRLLTNTEHFINTFDDSVDDIPVSLFQSPKTN